MAIPDSNHLGQQRLNLARPVGKPGKPPMAGCPQIYIFDVDNLTVRDPAH
jgi:hypothetical protein